MGSTIKRLFLGVILIVLASGLLLVSDWQQRRSGPRRIPRVALFVFSSQPVLAEGAEGTLRALEEHGFVDGRTIEIVKFNAEGDVATASAIARQIAGDPFDLVITMSTPAMQAMANANKKGKVRHVFGLVADPFGAGIGLVREQPLNHPKHMAGSGIPLPAEDSFRLARKLFPELKKVGIAWNPTEINSQFFAKKAREIARELGIELVEANAENSSAVAEAVNSVISRGAQAIWVGGDNTLILAMANVVGAAGKARIPVFTIVPADPKRGTLFDLGANFFAAGQLTGKQAADILRGVDPAAMPIENYVPKKLVINRLALSGLRDPWRFPEEVLSQADVIVDFAGVHQKSAPEAKISRTAARPARKWNVSMIQYVNVSDVEEAEHGVLAGLKEAGLERGRDYRLTIRNAQGDMATVNSLIDAAVTEGADLLITFSTPTLQAALNRSRGTPIVFTYLASPVKAGAGKTDEDHLPYVTGVYNVAAYAEMMLLIGEVLPSARTLGTLFVPAEVNMVLHKDELTAEAKKAGFDVIAVPANTSAEVPDAALSLATRRPDALCQIPGNLSATAFPSILTAARKARLPIFAFQGSQVRSGALLALARDYVDAGREAGLVAARVLRGESPARIPFRPYSRSRLIVNLNAARSLKIRLPDSIIQKAEEVIGK